MANIIRNPTDAEKRDFTPILTPKGRDVNPQAKFQKTLAKEQLKANKKGLPFAEHAARAEWEDHYTHEKKRVVRQFGYLKADEVKTLKMDWAKFSDLKNFKVILEDEVYDDYLSQRHNKSVYIKKVEYRYKGFANRYIVMEDGMKALARAK